MKAILFILSLMLINSVFGYPNNETSSILEEKYPGVLASGAIILQDDGSGIYVRYNASGYPIPDNATMEALWNIIQNKRNIALQNATIANRIKQNYTQSMDDLYTIQNVANPTEAQQNWAIKREAAILQDILRFLKWVFWS